MGEGKLMPDYDIKDFYEGEHCWEDNNEQSYEKDSQVETWWQKIYAKFQRS
tara:strand:+ start:309 stop:461 length:153 start_codon:yes stop_codon:yes gene_type:complete